MISNFANQQFVAIKSALLTHGQTATANIDTRGFNDVTVTLAGSLAGAGTNPTVSFLTSDTTDATTFVTAVADQLMPTGTNECLVYHLPKDGAVKRYVRLSVTAPSGSTNSNVAPLVAIATLGRKDEGGVGAADIGYSTNSVVVQV